VLGEVTFGHGDDDAGDLGRRPAQIVDQGVHRAGAVGPGAVETLLVEARGQPTVTSDDAADAPYVQVLPLLK
jgi:hypothetical protein